MRSSEIQIHAKIPVPTDGNKYNANAVPRFHDKNGVVYQIKAIQDACDKAQNLPIIQRGDNGKEDIVGMAHSIKWNPDGFIEIDGVLRLGGTSESVTFGSDGDIFSMEITAIGLGTT